MFESITINIPELAERWSKTPRQILEHAAAMKLRLLFNFDGLVIDANGERLKQYDADQKREHEILSAFVKSAEDKFKRRIADLLSQRESLTNPEAVELRNEITTAQAKMKTIEESCDIMTRERLKYHYRGYLMASLETANDLLRQGFAKHPIRAYSLDGQIVRLEPAIAQWKERLEPADMMVGMSDVKAIEAAAEEQPAPAAKVEAKVDATPSGDEIPGKMPNVGSRKMTVKAAWQIECEKKRVASSTEVLTLLQEWADKGTEPGYLIKPDKIHKGVIWRTGKGVEILFDLEAIKKALEAWLKSRQ
jgi:hypothetical protein